MILALAGIAHQLLSSPLQIEALSPPTHQNQKIARDPPSSSGAAPQNSIRMDEEGSVAYEQQLELDEFDQTLNQAMDKMVSSKQELAAKLRMILSVKRKIDDVPTQAELIQYERRLSELYSQIRDKHRQTSTLYDTYNSLLEIKELMLKETSILNSINSQFQDALTSTIGRSKLVDSLETIVKGARQKLEKVELSLLAEKKNSESLREKLTVSLTDQRHFSSLLKELQEECAKNERIRQAE